MEGPPFAQMAASFDQRVRELHGCVSLLAVPRDEQLESISRSLAAVEASFEALRGAVQAEKQCLHHADAVVARATEQAALLAKLMASMPAANAVGPSQVAAPPLALVSDSRSNLARRSQAPTQQRRKSLKPPGAVVLDALLEHVTQSELDGLRRDLKGRLTVEKLNTAIDELHQLMAVKKQLLLHKRPSTLKHGDAQRVKDWQALVTPETEGYAFFTENDLVDPPDGSKPSAAMVGATGKSMISALRTLGRIKEVRVNRTKVYLVL